FTQAYTVILRSFLCLLDGKTPFLIYFRCMSFALNANFLTF
ncbi:hypothetical protein BAE44_0019148, partial [Dichanthelium oligosanthes]